MNIVDDGEVVKSKMKAIYLKTKKTQEKVPFKLWIFLGDINVHALFFGL